MQKPKKINPKTFCKKIRDYYQDEICHLYWEEAKPWTLLFAVMLSARTTDKGVNKATPSFFGAFPQLEDYAVRPIEEIYRHIKTIGLYKTKGRNIQSTAQKILLEHKGKIPNTIAQLTTFPGVGRKTANVVLWNLFKKNEGFVVDTHVGRISQRTGLTLHKDPVKIEKDLMTQIPQKEWGQMSHRLVQFGRDFCRSQNPKCGECFLASACPKNLDFKPQKP